MATKKLLGQYFTTDESLLNRVKILIMNKEGTILEPSFGQGNLLEISFCDNTRPIIGYEIDKNIKILKSLREKVSRCHAVIKLRYTDFLSANIKERFTTIVANPPYCKIKGSQNLYLEFIKKCYSLLESDGEMIFIVPSDFLKATNSAGLIEEMSLSGSFTHFYFPDCENLFDGASIDVVVFRYQLGLKQNTTIVNDVVKYIDTTDGIISFSNSENRGVPIENLFDVYVGIVSGKDDVFQSDHGNVKVLTDFDTEKKFVLVSRFPTKSEKINDLLLENKDALLARRIRKFTETNWFEWGALRNINAIKDNVKKPCIYVRTITRKDLVATKGQVQLFSGSLLCLIPKETLNLDDIVDQINANRNDYTYSGRFKITHRQLSKMRIY